jgi:hypothetical protein
LPSSCLMKQRIVRFRGIRVLRCECRYPSGVFIQTSTIATDHDIREQLHRLLKMRAERQKKPARHRRRKRAAVAQPSRWELSNHP